MEHPLISDLDKLTIEQLQERISDLTKKFSWAQRSRNYNLCAQLQLAIQTFQGAYEEKTKAAWEAQKKDGTDFSNKINIS